MRLEDLPPKLREQAAAKLGEKPKRPRTQAAGRSGGRCFACDWSGTYGAWEKHLKAEHGTCGRFEILEAVT